MKGIAFSPEMVRAILDNRKTMTRQEIKGIEQFPVKCRRYEGGSVEFLSEDHTASKTVKPKYKVGEVVYVKEAWEYFEPETEIVCGVSYDISSEAILYKSDHTEDVDFVKWKSPATMPEWASRLKLRITEVRVERLQDISEEDALREGIQCQGCGYTSIDAGMHMDHHLCKTGGSVEAFKQLWESIKGAGSWDANPWVWVYSFEVV